MNTSLSSIDEITESLASETNRAPDNAKTGRLIDWNTEVLYRLLENVVANRENTTPLSREELHEMEKERVRKMQGYIVIDEMTQILELPRTLRVFANDQPKMDPNVKEQLREFISRISLLYRDVPFHNFEHCSHVIMSASK